MAEALLVGDVPFGQRLAHLVAGGRGAGLLGRRPSAARRTRSPIRGCAFMLSTISSQLKALNAASTAAWSSAGSR